MTVSKAYGLLEERGYLVRLRGKGMVVADRSEEVSTKEKLPMLKK
jgi:DNA-binding GntR family transcriptional regulator